MFEACRPVFARGKIEYVNLKIGLLSRKFSTVMNLQQLSHSENMSLFPDTEVLSFAASFGGLIATGAVLYQFFVPLNRRKIILQNMVIIFDNISKRRWLYSILKTFTLFYSITNKIYGPPNQYRGGVLQFLTERAWKISATIVGFYLFILPIIAVTMIIGAVFIVATIDGDFMKLYYIHTIASLICGVIALTAIWYIFRSSKQSLNKKTKHFTWENFAAIIQISNILSFIFLFFTLIAFGLVIAKQEEFLEYIAVGFGSAFFTIFFVIAPLGILLYSIYKFGVIAPLATFSIITIFLMNLSTIMINYQIIVFWYQKIFEAEIRVPIEDSYVNYLMLPVAVCHLYLIISFMKYIRSNEENRERQSKKNKYIVYAIVVTGVVIIYNFVFKSPFSNIFPGEETALYNHEVAIFAIAFIGQFLLFIYVPIYANSIPDCLSVAFTRYILSEILLVSNIKQMTKLLLMDLLVASMCVIMSIFIIWLGANMIQLLFEINIRSIPDFRESSYNNIINKLVELVENTVSSVLPEVQDATLSNPPGKITETGVIFGKEIGVVVLIAYASTASLPSVVGLLFLMYAVLFRCAAATFAFPARYILGLLTESGALWRSAGIVGFIGVILVLGIFSIIKLIIFV